MAARIYAVFALLLLLQLGLWSHTRHIMPDMSIVPDVPGRNTLQALSFGDAQFLFRLTGLRIQNSGDTFGRFTALYKYDFNKLYHWFRLLDDLDNTSDYVPSMATYYFSQTQNKPDVRYVVDYLREHTDGRVQLKWWWIVQSIYLANHKLEDKDLALALSRPLIGARGVPLWVRQMPAFILEQRGENEAAYGIIQGILQNQSEGEISQGEMNFIRSFTERLGLTEDGKPLKKTQP